MPKRDAPQDAPRSFDRGAKGLTTTDRLNDPIMRAIDRRRMELDISIRGLCKSARVDHRGYRRWTQGKQSMQTGVAARLLIALGLEIIPGEWLIDQNETSSPLE